MSYQTWNLTRLRKQRLVILLSLAALTGTLLVYGAASAHAQEPAPQAPPATAGTVRYRGTLFTATYRRRLRGQDRSRSTQSTWLLAAVRSTSSCDRTSL